MKTLSYALPAGLFLLLGCGIDNKSDDDFRAEIIGKMHTLLLDNVQALSRAARDLQAAAPTPTDRGWDSSDQAALDAMKKAWNEMRKPWESGEGVLASLFPDLDEALDSRYEDMLTTLGPSGDVNLFDRQGVIGMHAVERILFAAGTPESVIAREAKLTGYVPAAWPATAEQAAEFKNGLCAQLVDDSASSVTLWNARTIDLADIFLGLTTLMSAQQEKMSRAAEHSAESRYAPRTMGDLRDNLSGTKATYRLFMPWLDAKPSGAAINAEAEGAFARLSQIYATVEGEAIPEPPPTWNSALPSVADQKTPFGKLYQAVVQEVDPALKGSAVDAMNHVARTLGLPEFVPQN